MPADVAVIILTFNEELNLSQALRSVCGWAREVHVLDSASTDRTAEIAKSFNVNFAIHPFEDYSKQRDFALDELPIQAEWVFFLDGDEWLTQELKDDVARKIASHPIENGFYVCRRLIWMGQWIRWGGYYPTWILRLFRKGYCRCEDRPVNEHLIVKGPTARLRGDLVHEDHKGLTEWIAKHNRYASLEAAELLSGKRETEIPARILGAAPERKRWVRIKIWNRLPLLVRPFLFFVYRYGVRLGFLNGYRAFTFHFMQEAWLHLLIDAKYLELRTERRRNH